MRPTHRIDGHEHCVRPLRRGPSQLLDIDGVQLEASLRWTGDHEAVLAVDGAQRLVHAAQDGTTLFVHLDGQTWRIEAVNGFADRAVGGGTDGQVRAPMPGVVIEIHVQAGDGVAENQRLALIESMKMQTEITAPLAGTVTAVHVAPGASFERGAALIELERSA